MKTRKDYLDNKCTHREYYSQYVTESTKRIVLSRFSKKLLIESFQEDEHLNNIPLQQWDMLEPMVRYNRTKLKENGDQYSLSSGVCILKEAAKQIVESSN